MCVIVLTYIHLLTSSTNIELQQHQTLTLQHSFHKIVNF